jgi:UDP-N-acetylglucosamine--N-acetylmuramyl-(pentapeptide) pyrophosphoryl-undecaprenol N-acetylglucosamine transferase
VSIERILVSLLTTQDSILMTTKNPYRIILSGGGTGGHIFPAIAIANEFKARHADADILFVGAEGKMEMTRVPEAGYKIVGLPIIGLQRKLTLSNLLLPFKLAKSYFRASAIIKSFNPHAVIGTGGYASGPMLMAANGKGIPTLLQEQNSYAGLTNKRLAAKAKRICVAYSGMEKYFPSQKLTLTGNPVRKDINAGQRERALQTFGLEPGRKTLLVIGGSLGARTLNESIFDGLDKLGASGVQVIWQCGKLYLHEFKNRTAGYDMRYVKMFDFLHQMDLAYAAADVVVSRAGALSISELCIVGKPTVLVPSPNVAEDHQTKNAKALADVHAALLVKDVDANEVLVDELLKLIYDEQRCARLAQNIKALARPNATMEIVNELEKLIAETNNYQPTTNNK